MTSKEYQLYDEANKKFILSRDVIFLETDKDSLTVERQLNQIEKFVPQKFYYESNNILPHPKGGIPIFDQSMEFPSLNDEKLVDDDNFVVADEELVDVSVSTETMTEMARTEPDEEDEQLPKQLPTQPLRRSTRIRTFPKKYDEFKVGSSSGNYSHCEFNFSVDCEPTCFEEAASYEQWKYAMQNEYDSLIKLAHGGWWILLLASNLLVANGFIKLSLKLMVN